MMKFAENLEELYGKYFETNDYLPLFVHSILEQMTHKDLVHVLKQCEEEELQELVANVIIHHIHQSTTNTLTPPSPYSSSKQQEKAL